MLSTLKSRLLLAAYIFLLLSIPVGFYLASHSQNPNAAAKNKDRGNKDRGLTNQNSGFNSPGIKDLKNLSSPQKSPSSTPLPSPTPEGTATFGPIADFILQLEGRPANKQSAKIFVGIAEGEITNNPKYLLTFSITLSDDGRYQNLSLAGLTAGNRYSTYLKGPSQIATASSFLMSSFTSHLNDNQPLLGLSGDLNDDNIINDGDLTVAKISSGLTASSPNFNDNADINRDGVVNSFDIGFITKNLGKIGAGGQWTSPPPKP